jgi:hypothetical protein
VRCESGSRSRFRSRASRTGRVILNQVWGNRDGCYTAITPNPTAGLDSPFSWVGMASACWHNQAHTTQLPVVNSNGGTTPAFKKVIGAKDSVYSVHSASRYFFFTLNTGNKSPRRVSSSKKFRRSSCRMPVEKQQGSYFYHHYTCSWWLTYGLWGRCWPLTAEKESKQLIREQQALYMSQGLCSYGE